MYVYIYIYRMYMENHHVKWVNQRTFYGNFQANDVNKTPQGPAGFLCHKWRDYIQDGDSQWRQRSKSRFPSGDFFSATKNWDGSLWRLQINKGGYHNNVHLIFPWYSYDFHWFSIFFHTFPLISVDTTTTCTFPQIFPIVFRMNFFCPQVDITTTCTGIRTSFTPGIPQTAAGWLRPSSGSVERSSGTFRWPGLALRSVVSGRGISPWGKFRGGEFSRWKSCDFQWWRVAGSTRWIRVFL